TTARSHVSAPAASSAPSAARSRQARSAASKHHSRSKRALIVPAIPGCYLGGGPFCAAKRRRGLGMSRPEGGIAGKQGPFSATEYLESLRDGREVWIYGERVDDVTTHPAFRNAARSLAKLYDALHDPAQRDVLTCPVDTGTGTFTHRFFRIARSREDLIGQREAIAHWPRMTYGCLAPTPAYQAS